MNSLYDVYMLNDAIKASLAKRQLCEFMPNDVYPNQFGKCSLWCGIVRQAGSSVTEANPEIFFDICVSEKIFAAAFVQWRFISFRFRLLIRFNLHNLFFFCFFCVAFMLFFLILFILLKIKYCGRRWFSQFRVIAGFILFLLIATATLTMKISYSLS